MSADGRQGVRDFGISDAISNFMPSQYAWGTQRHHRMIIKVYFALRQVLGASFSSWASEDLLRSEEEWRHQKDGGNVRVLDGVVYIQMKKFLYQQTAAGGVEPTGEIERETWKCGIEVELSLKSPDRYEKQFRSLSV